MNLHPLAHGLLLSVALAGGSAAAQITLQYRPLVSAPLTGGNEYACHVHNTSASTVTITHLQVVGNDAYLASFANPTTITLNTCAALQTSAGYLLPAGRSCQLRLSVPPGQSLLGGIGAQGLAADAFPMVCRVRHTATSLSVVGALQSWWYDAASGKSTWRGLVALEELPAVSLQGP